MGISLYGLTPATTYDALIKTGDNEPLTASLKVLSDGVGTNLPMEASTTAINFTGTLTQAGTTLQPTLVSGTNIKTINGTTILGSGNIVTPQPSGVAGAIQFSNGSAFASDAANLFWDDTNNRLGIGTNSPVAGPFHVKTTQSNANGSIIFTNNTTATILAATDTGSALTQLQFRASSYNFTDTAGMRIASTGYATTPTAMLQVVGSGSTSATTSLLVQNSSASQLLKVTDNGQMTVISSDLYADILLSNGSAANTGIKSAGYTIYLNSNATNIASWSFQTYLNASKLAVGGTVGSMTPNASSVLDCQSTVGGFLPPRMTTTQKNAIATPATGLIVMDITTFKLCVYNGTSWVDLH